MKGPAWVCDEIRRDESPDYVQRNLSHSLLGYINAGAFTNRRILDFGCGSGASTVVLARMFPDSDIVGIELDAASLSLAQKRASFYGIDDRVTLLHSAVPAGLPPGLGSFDHIIMSAVFEHLLPAERRMLLPALWGNPVH